MYDLAIIGAGWAGFSAACRARDLGLKVCLLENNSPGGTCLNRGCIPTKALIQSAKVYSLIKKSSVFGIEVPPPVFNLAKALERKNKLIEQLRQGMQFMLKGVDLVSAAACIVSSRQIKAGGSLIEANAILIASGSTAVELPGFKFDGKSIISSDEALNLSVVPDSLLVIGGGAIGCEFASLFYNLGSKVTIAEKLPHLLPGLDSQVSAKLESLFKKRGITVNTGADVALLDPKQYAQVLVCVGRSGNTKGLGLEAAGIKTENGMISVSDTLETSVPGIFAAGDCASKIKLAHFAAYQGRLVAENLTNKTEPAKVNQSAVPNCIFCEPEIGSIGLSEDEGRKSGREIQTHRFDFMASGMARIMDEAEGFIKIVSDKKNGQLLGAAIIGPKATELIAVLSVAISNQRNISELRNTIFSHPSLSECLSEAVRT